MNVLELLEEAANLIACAVALSGCTEKTVDISLPYYAIKQAEADFDKIRTAYVVPGPQQPRSGSGCLTVYHNGLMVRFVGGLPK